MTRALTTSSPAAASSDIAHLCAATVLAFAALILAAGSAFAHVGITPREAPPNTSQTFYVRVPTEKDSATVRVRIEFPAGVTVSRFQPKPGWQRAVDRDGTGRITAVTWSGGRIENGEFDDFVFQARTPEATGALRFRSFQTYADGETVEWINNEEPRPAPVVDIRAAAQAAGAAGEHGQALAPAAAAAAPAGPVATTGTASTAATATRATTVAGPVASGALQPATASGGPDLALFIALGSGVIALLSLALAGIALARRSPAAGSAGAA